MKGQNSDLSVKINVNSKFLLYKAKNKNIFFFEFCGFSQLFIRGFWSSGICGWVFSEVVNGDFIITFKVSRSIDLEFLKPSQGYEQPTQELDSSRIPEDGSPQILFFLKYDVCSIEKDGRCKHSEFYRLH